jgi:peroxiredoxin
MENQMRIHALSFFALSALAASTAPAQSAAVTQQSATSAPAVGDPAPEFALPAANANGTITAPVKLSEYHGRVVVVAFYPLDRSSGCTAELTKFRDDFASIFGDGVVVLPISIDSVGAHASWAKDMKFPFALLSDRDQKVAMTYGSTMAGRPYDSRTVFVVGRDGRVVYRDLKFGALNEQAYKDLATAVSKARG